MSALVVLNSNLVKAVVDQCMLHEGQVEITSEPENRQSQREESAFEVTRLKISRCPPADSVLRAYPAPLQIHNNPTYSTIIPIINLLAQQAYLRLPSTHTLDLYRATQTLA